MATVLASWLTVTSFASDVNARSDLYGFHWWAFLWDFSWVYLLKLKLVPFFLMLVSFFVS